MPVTRAKKKSTVPSQKAMELSSEDDDGTVKIIDSKINKKSKKHAKRDRVTRSHLSMINDEPTDPEEIEPADDNAKTASLNLSDKENNVKPVKKKKNKKQKHIDADEMKVKNAEEISEEEPTVFALPKRKNRKKNKSSPIMISIENEDNTDKSVTAVSDSDTDLKQRENFVITPLKRENTYTVCDKSTDDNGEKQLSTKKLTFAEASPSRLFKSSKPKNVTNFTTPPKTFCRSISVGSAGKTPMPPLNKTADTSGGESSNIKRSLLTDLDSDTKPAIKKRTFAAASPCKLFKKSKPSDTLVLKTPPKTMCRTISIGSAGRTPMPPPEKKTDENDLTAELQKNTPKKVRILNLTHSIEKKEEKPIVQRKSVKFISPVFKNRLRVELKSKIPTKTANNKGSHRINKATSSVIEKKTKGITKPPKKTLTTFSEAKSKQIVNMLRSTCTSTPTTHSLTKPAQPVSRSKMPNFASLHKKQFEQMESIIQNKTRKEERAKKLLFFSNTPSSQKNVKKEKSITDKDQCQINANEHSRFGFKPISDNFKTLPNVSYQDSPRTKSNVMTKIKESKITSTNKKREESQNYIVGVRTNRRFELQMKSRNINS